MQRKEALICCKGMTEDPENWVHAVRRCSVAIVLKIAYGLDVDGPTSPWIGLAEDSANAIGKAGAPGSSIMDLLPASTSHSPPLKSAGLLTCCVITARYLPDWLPFMERLRYAHTWKSAIESITKLPFEASLRQMVWLACRCRNV